MRVPGFEPGAKPWQGFVLPNYTTPAFKVRWISQCFVRASQGELIFRYIILASSEQEKFLYGINIHSVYATVAQPVECHLGKVEVAGSIPAGGSDV